jgi:hypothetical protein
LWSASQLKEKTKLLLSKSLPYRLPLQNQSIPLEARTPPKMDVKTVEFKAFTDQKPGT